VYIFHSHCPTCFTATLHVTTGTCYVSVFPHHHIHSSYSYDWWNISQSFWILIPLHYSTKHITEVYTNIQTQFFYQTLNCDSHKQWRIIRPPWNCGVWPTFDIIWPWSYYLFYEFINYTLYTMWNYLLHRYYVHHFDMCPTLTQPEPTEHFSTICLVYISVKLILRQVWGV